MLFTVRHGVASLGVETQLLGAGVIRARLAVEINRAILSKLLAARRCFEALNIKSWYRRAGGI